MILFQTTVTLFALWLIAVVEAEAYGYGYGRGGYGSGSVAYGSSYGGYGRGYGGYGYGYGKRDASPVVSNIILVDLLGRVIQEI